MVTRWTVGAHIKELRAEAGWDAQLSPAEIEKRVQSKATSYWAWEEQERSLTSEKKTKILNKLLKKHKPDVPTPHTCPFCAKEFSQDRWDYHATTKKYRKALEKLSETAGERMVTCSCGQVLPLEAMVGSHLTGEGHVGRMRELRELELHEQEVLDELEARALAQAQEEAAEEVGRLKSAEEKKLARLREQLELELAARKQLAPIPCEYCGEEVHPDEVWVHLQECSVYARHKHVTERIRKLAGAVERADLTEAGTIIHEVDELLGQVKGLPEEKKLRKSLKSVRGEAEERAHEAGAEERELRVQGSIERLKRVAVTRRMSRFDPSELTSEEFEAQETAAALMHAKVRAKPPKVLKKAEKRVKKAVKERARQRARVEERRRERAELVLSADVEGDDEKRARLLARVRELDERIGAEQDRLDEITRALQALEDEVARLVREVVEV